MVKPCYFDPTLAHNSSHRSSPTSAEVEATRKVNFLFLSMLEIANQHTFSHFPDKDNSGTTHPFLNLSQPYDYSASWSRQQWPRVRRRAFSHPQLLRARASPPVYLPFYFPHLTRPMELSVPRRDVLPVRCLLPKRYSEKTGIAEGRNKRASSAYSGYFKEEARLLGGQPARIYLGDISQGMAIHESSWRVRYTNQPSVVLAFVRHSA